MIPSAKILALAYLLITVQRGSVENNEQRIRLYRIVEFIGRWSMVDVFVDAFTAALVQLQPLMSVAPGARPVLLRGGRRADDARGRVVRSAADLGFRKLERGSTCLTPNPPLARRPGVANRLQETHAALRGLDRPDRGGGRRRLGRRDPDPERGAHDHDRLQVGRGPRGRQDQDPVQRRRRRHARRRPALRRPQARASPPRRWRPRREDFLVDDTRFWVVRPRISGANVTGLGTLISGAYIGMDIGQSKQARSTTSSRSKRRRS